MACSIWRSINSALRARPSAVSARLPRVFFCVLVDFAPVLLLEGILETVRDVFVGLLDRDESLLDEALRDEVPRDVALREEERLLAGVVRRFMR